MIDDRLVADVGAFLREAAARAILPRFRALTTGEVLEKSPGEVVTRADREAEQILQPALRSRIAGSTVIGEEDAAANPSILGGIDEGTVWLVDPLDGTANFVAGDARFALMVALLRHGETVASWMLDPLRDVLTTAVRGAGAFLDGARVRCPATPVAAPDLRGAVLSRFLPPPAAAAIAARSPRVGAVTPGARCAGVEYPSIADGSQHFAVFWRTLPWDHAPGTLFLTEAGGSATRFDGSAYRVGDGRSGLLAARDAGVAAIVRSELLGAAGGA